MEIYDEYEKVLKELNEYKRIVEDLKYHLSTYDYNKLSDGEKILISNIDLILKGIIKVVRDE